MLLRAGGRGSRCNNAASGNKAPLTPSQVEDHGKAQLSSLQCGLCDVRPAPCSAWLRAVAGLTRPWLALVRPAPARPACARARVTALQA